MCFYFDMILINISGRCREGGGGGGYYYLELNMWNSLMLFVACFMVFGVFFSGSAGIHKTFHMTPNSNLYELFLLFTDLIY